MKYYKISPEWAEKLEITKIGVKHPDGWFLVLPNFVTKLTDEKEDKNLDAAIEEIGGCIYSDSEALASMRGEKDYMMNQKEEGQE